MTVPIRAADPSTIAAPGHYVVTAEEVVRHAGIDFVAFMEARHSVRQYEKDRPVEFGKIERAQVFDFPICQFAQSPAQGFRLECADERLARRRDALSQGFARGEALL